MARKPRIDLAGVAQHVIQRGNDRQPCFFRAIDYQRYLQDLREITLARDCHVHAYVLMTNHVHLLMTPRASPTTCITSNLWATTVSVAPSKHNWAAASPHEKPEDPESRLKKHQSQTVPARSMFNSL